MWQPPERIKHALPDTEWPTAEAAAQARLFSPIDIGSKRAATRTWVPAMVPWRATEDGFVSDDVIDWYGRFAQGKPGVIVVEATGIRDIPSGPLLRIGHDRFIDGLARLTSAVKEASDGETLVFIQLIDFLTVRRRPEAATYFKRYLALGQRHKDALAEATTDEAWCHADDDDARDFLASASEDIIAAVLTDREREDLNFGYRERVWDMHLPQIRDLPKVLPPLFADASERAFAAGFDGVELHYAHAYTMASFLSALNTRNDGYGGDREHRIRLPIEVIDAVRERVGTSAVVGARYLGDDVIAEGSHLRDALYFGRRLAAAGLDFLSVSKGGKFEDAKQPKVGATAYPYTGQSGYECMPTVYSDERGPFGRNVPLAAAIKSDLQAAATPIPVITSGGICTFDQAEQILQDGEADIVASARQTLADPDWFLKAHLGSGSQIRRCEFTNYCEALDQKHKTVTCKLWDRTQLDEPDLKLDTTGRRRLVAPAWRRDETEKSV